MCLETQIPLQVQPKLLTAGYVLFGAALLFLAYDSLEVSSTAASAPCHRVVLATIPFVQ